MTTIIYKDGQFQTEDGIPFEDQIIINTIVNKSYFDNGVYKIPVDGKYSINEISTELIGCDKCHLNQGYTKSPDCCGKHKIRIKQ